MKVDLRGVYREVDRLGDGGVGVGTPTGEDRDAVVPRVGRLTRGRGTDPGLDP